MEDGQALKLLERPQSEEGGHKSVGGEKGAEELDSNQENGINFWQTAILLAGSCAGMGFLTIDVLVVGTGWSGLSVFLVLYITLVYTSVILGRCWNMVRDKWGSERYPYGAIGYEAFGDKARKLSNFLVAASCFSITVSVLLALSESTLAVGGPALQGTLCYWPLAYGLLICPLLWLGTPKHFWWMLAFSFFSMVLAVILITISIYLTGHSDTRGFTDASEGIQQEGVYLHLAEIAGMVPLVMGTHPALPTVQQDMKQPQVYTRSVVTAFTLLLLINLPIMVALYIVYGDNLNVTGTAIIFTLLPDDALKKVSSLLVLVHLFGIVLLMNNPLFQYLEEVLHISTDFSWKRAVLRSFILFLEIFIQETFPHYTLLGSITGGFLVPILSLLGPCLYYVRLRRQHQQEPSKWFKLEIVVCFFIIAATPCLMVAVLYGVGTAVARGNTTFTAPCYVNASQVVL